jgi:class 3 adenylate cyclase
MAELPRGTVTFLFTDIEGSTRLLHELGERYADVLADQRRLLREAFARHNGCEVDTQGDSFFVAFANAGEAVGAAADAQTALAGHGWPQGVSLRVRMGLHTREPLVADDHYVGIDVHRGARMAAAAHGGRCRRLKHLIPARIIEPLEEATSTMRGEQELLGSGKRPPDSSP